MIPARRSVVTDILYFSFWQVLGTEPKLIVVSNFEHIIKHIVMFAQMDDYDPSVTSVLLGFFHTRTRSVSSSSSLSRALSLSVCLLA